MKKMCCTKSKILEISLQLYNKCGLKNVSQRMISNELGISPGNLTYHFKRTEDILENLFIEMVNEIDLLFEESQSKQLSLKNLIHLYISTMGVLYKNKFFMLDFVQIIRYCDRINIKYIEVTDRRHQQHTQTIIQLIENKYLKPPSFKGEYIALYQRMGILSDFWMSTEIINQGVISEEAINHYAFINMADMYPYLTEKGKHEFEECFGIYMN